jgi:hypothetical protein
MSAEAVFASAPFDLVSITGVEVGVGVDGVTTLATFEELLLAAGLSKDGPCSKRIHDEKKKE